jgi:hypothetical protein
MGWSAIEEEEEEEEFLLSTTDLYLGEMNIYTSEELNEKGNFGLVSLFHNVVMRY